eukprot:CAMPEP_0204576052 /NCGR_PEP_ID=MMETSP0661-20131031/41548_1 /ASSEMBLY_ACC=CAM_ASM_000606 /TAXON_ID=109239 /ORGANISM="Alexandrium margalefi, Strain AMGDE01CS-322" /LENGTH=91 /DNA_ID=CAMNT_0051584751 /DNA_START=54 /DNA_END=327 /DNA_ORIENTATION=+
MTLGRAIHGPLIDRWRPVDAAVPELHFSPAVEDGMGCQTAVGAFLRWPLVFSPLVAAIQSKAFLLGSWPVGSSAIFPGGWQDFLEFDDDDD